MTGDDLPEDLVVQILLRLPAKSLIRFKCGCKSWCALISNPSFISKNLLFSFNNKKNAHLLVRRGDIITNHEAFSFLSYDTLELSVTRDLTRTEVNKAKYIEIVGSACNGIICLSFQDPGHKVALWNPATNEIKVLPESRVHVKYAGPRYGFGFDCKTKDYKVVKIHDMWHPVEVYSLSNDSWRELDDKFPGTFLGEQTYTKGIFSWWALDDFGVESDDGLVSFDISNEVFKKIPLPDVSIIGGVFEGHMRYFFSYNDSISLVLCHYIDNQCSEKCWKASMKWKKSFEIWVLLEYGVKESWTKLYHIEPIPGVEQPLGFGKNGELFLEVVEGKLVLYDPTTQDISNLRSQIVGVEKSLQLVTYVETRVPIKGGSEPASEDN